MNRFADIPSSPPLAGEDRQALALSAVEGEVKGLEWQKRRPLAPPALSRSPILYLVSLRWAAGRRWRPARRNGRK